MKNLIVVFQVYDRVIKIVAPKKAKLLVAEADLTNQNAEINCVISGVWSCDQDCSAKEGQTIWSRNRVGQSDGQTQWEKGSTPTSHW